MQEQLNRKTRDNGNSATGSDDEGEQIAAPKLDIKLMDRISAALLEQPVFNETIYHECCNCGMHRHEAGSSGKPCCGCFGSSCRQGGINRLEERRQMFMSKR